MIDERDSDAQLLEKVLEVQMFHVMTSASARTLRARPSGDAIWLRTAANPIPEIRWLRKLGFRAPILVSARIAIPEEPVDPEFPKRVLVQVPFGLKVKDLEARLVSVLGLTERPTPDMGLGMNQRVFVTVFDRAERHFLRELVAAYRESEDKLTSADRLKEVAKIEHVASRMSRLRTKAWLFGFKIETIGDMYALKLDP